LHGGDHALIVKPTCGPGTSGSIEISTRRLRNEWGGRSTCRERLGQELMGNCSRIWCRRRVLLFPEPLEHIAGSDQGYSDACPMARWRM
jgi:hypothetical protein